MKNTKSVMMRKDGTDLLEQSLYEHIVEQIGWDLETPVSDVDEWNILNLEHKAAVAEYLKGMSIDDLA
jgi:hypothetical protein